MKLALAAAALIILAGCSHDDPTFGSSYDACVLKHGANDTAKEICERHFSRAPTNAEDDTIRESSRGTAKLILNQEGNILTGNKPWDKIDAQVLNRDDDLVVTKAKLTATFFSDAAMTQRLKRMPLVWDGLDVDDSTGTVVGLFGEDRAPSLYMLAFVEPSRLYSHTKR